MMIDASASWTGSSTKASLLRQSSSLNLIGLSIGTRRTNRGLSYAELGLAKADLIYMENMVAQPIPKIK
jgi:hypothetical protein